MKKIMGIVLTISMASCMLFSFTGSAYAAKILTLKHSPMYVTIGGSINQYLLTASGKKVNGKKITWTVNNPKRINVSKSGKITGLTKGSTLVKAKYKGNTYKFKVYIKYAKKEFSEASLAVGESITQVIYAASGNKASVNKIEFTSSNSNIVTVDSEGKITAISEGTAKIYAKYFGKKYIATITVLPKNASKIEEKEENTNPSFGGGSSNYSGKSDDSGLKRTSYEEYKQMLSEGEETFNAFASEFCKEYSKEDYIVWLVKMQDLEKQEEQHDYTSRIDFE